MTNAAYARSAHGETRAGRVILVVTSCLSAVLVIAGLIYAMGAGQRNKAALAAAECEPNLSPSGLQCTTVQVLTTTYNSMVTPAIQQLVTDGADYRANERHHLAAAEAALMAEVASEDALGTSLARFPFPPAVAPAAKALIRADHALAGLTAVQARSSALTQMRSFNDQVQAASAGVQAEMSLISGALGKRPTANQEP